MGWFIVSLIAIAVLIVVGTPVISILARMFYKIPQQGQALVRIGKGGIQVSTTDGVWVFPAIHRLEIMDVDVKCVEIHRSGSTGLICQDNLRADIKVNFFIRVNKDSDQDVTLVAQTIGCKRASDSAALTEIFEPRFSDALKTVGRKFTFEQLLDERKEFRDAIVKVIGAEALNGFVLDEAAIDVIEQTKVELLDPNNILDAEGRKKITDRTAREAVLTNEFERDRERDINKKDVETQEVILQQNKELAEAQAKQHREVASIQAREEAETIRVQQEERLKSEKARLITEEEVAITEQNRDRQIIVAQRNKERTDAIEIVRVNKDREIEDIERQRLVSIADIEKQKVVETEQKNLQLVIRDRVMVQKDVVTEEQRVKDEEAFATADREKKVLMTMAEADAEQELIKEIKAAEAAKKAAELNAQREVIDADAEQNAASKIAAGKKSLAEGITAEQAASGLAEAKVIEAKAGALEKQGTAEATVMRQKFEADADGIVKKADAMKLFHEAGREHEEFKLRLDFDKEITLSEIAIRKDIAEAAARVVGEALKSAKIDIVGGETEFFDRIVNAVTYGKVVDRTVDNSRVLENVRDTFFANDPKYFKSQLQKWLDQFDMSSDDVKNLSIAAVLSKFLGRAADKPTRNKIQELLKNAERAGVEKELVDNILGSDK